MSEEDYLQTPSWAETFAWVEAELSEAWWRLDTAIRANEPKGRVKAARRAYRHKLNLLAWLREQESAPRRREAREEAKREAKMRKRLQQWVAKENATANASAKGSDRGETHRDSRGEHGEMGV